MTDRTPAATRALVLHVEFRSRVRGRNQTASGGRTPASRLSEALGLSGAIDLAIVDSAIVTLAAPHPATLLGPGKVALLDAIEETGTLAGAAQAMGMSYMRAWKLVQTMNACFREPLVVTSRGGNRHGTAVLTETGQAVRALYRRMEESCLSAAAPLTAELASYLSGRKAR